MSEPLSGVHKAYGQTFKLDEGSLRKISDTLRDHLKKLPEKPFHIRYTAYRADESFYEVDDIDKVLTDDNSKSRRINRLLVRVLEKSESDLDTKDDKSLVMIDFDIDDSKPVRVNVRGPDRDWCFLLAQDLDAQIERIIAGKIKTLLSARWSDLVIGLLLSAALSSAAAWIFFKSTVPENAVLDPSDPNFDIPNAYHGILFNIRIVYFVLGGFLLFILLGVLSLSNILKRLLCSCVFYWGDEVEAYDRRKAWGRNIFWIVIVGLIISFIAGKLAAKF